MLLNILVPDSWSHIFVPDVPFLEIFLRGSIVYLTLFIALRGILKREAAGVGISDLLVIVLLADAVQNGMAGEYTSVPDSLFLGFTIIGWDYALNFAAFRYPRLRRLIRPGPLKLIEGGQLIRRHANKEMLTHEEIMGQLRQQGIDSIEKVKEAWMEGDGVITAIPFSKDESGEQKKEGNPAV